MADVSNISGKQGEIEEVDLFQLVVPAKNIKKEVSVEEEILKEDYQLKEAVYESRISAYMQTAQSTPSSNGNIVHRILRLLSEMLPVMQHLGTAQANLLNLPTRMQAMYTELIAKAPYYSKAQIEDEKDREAANQKVAIYSDRLRSFRDIWSDLGKKFQSLINTTNEAVNQLIDIFNTLLQQLRELVSLITR